GVAEAGARQLLEPREAVAHSVLVHEQPLGGRLDVHSAGEVFAQGGRDLGRRRADGERLEVAGSQRLADVGGPRPRGSPAERGQMVEAGERGGGGGDEGAGGETVGLCEPVQRTWGADADDAVGGGDRSLAQEPRDVAVEVRAQAPAVLDGLVKAERALEVTQR